MQFGLTAISIPAFRSRNYRLFFAGQGLSLIGVWMTRIATIWLVYELTQSAFLLGVVGFLNLIPSLILVPLSGVLVDRWDRHQTLIVTQAIAMIQALTLAALTLTGTIQLWHIMGLGMVQGVIKSFDAPTRQAFVPEMVEQKSDLASAIALNSSIFNGARLIGPAIAGLLIANFGAGICFLVDGLSYIAVIAALKAMRFEPKSQPEVRLTDVSKTPFLQNLREGLSYAYHVSAIRYILLLLALVSFMGLQYTVILPVFATEVLQGGSETLGTLVAALGVGALMAGAYLSVRQNNGGLERLIAIAPALMGTALIALAFAKVLWLSVLIIMGIGFTFLLQSASSNTLIQTLVKDDKRGRVMSLYVVAFLGMVPLGNLFVGSLISWVGVSATLILTGSCCIVASALFTQQLPHLTWHEVRPSQTH